MLVAPREEGFWEIRGRGVIVVNPKQAKRAKDVCKKSWRSALCTTQSSGPPTAKLGAVPSNVDR